MCSYYSQATNRCEFSDPLDDIYAPDIPTSNIWMSFIDETVTAVVTVAVESLSLLFVGSLRYIPTNRKRAVEIIPTISVLGVSYFYIESLYTNCQSIPTVILYKVQSYLLIFLY